MKKLVTSLKVIEKPYLRNARPKKGSYDMIKKWLHVADLGGDPWVLPIYSSKNRALKRGAIQEFGKDVYGLGLHISTRLSMLPRIVRRLKEGLSVLYTDKKVKEANPATISSKDKPGPAIIIDDNLKYRILIDVNSLLFELNACCDFMKEFLRKIYNHIGKTIKKENSGKVLGKIIVDNNGNISWFKELDEHRNFFMHVGTPYFAIDFSNAPKKYDLLIMKESLKHFDDKKKYVTLSEFGHIIKGFMHARQVLQRHLIDYIDSL